MEQVAVRAQWRSYVNATLLVVAATAVGSVLRNHVAPVNLVMLYLLAVVITARWWGPGAAVLCSVLGVLSFDYFFVPPHLSFSVSDAEYIITFVVLLVVALTVSTLVGQLRDHSAELRQREQESSALYAFSRSMVVAKDLGEIAEAAVSHAQASLGQPVSILLRKDGGRGHSALQRGPDLTSQEEEAVNWSMAHAKPAGWGEPGQPDGTVGCIPLRTADGVVGVLAARHPQGGDRLTLAQRRLMEAFAAQVAVVAERLRLAEEARKAQLLIEADRLHDALLHSVSHSLRTPLVSIIGNLSAVLEAAGSNLDAATRRDLVQTAREEAERLNGLVGHLLDMARLEAGNLQLLVDWYDLDEVVGAALAQAKRGLVGRPVHVHMPDEPLVVPLDQVLIVQVIENLLNNAAKYSPPGVPVQIDVRTVGAEVEISVADQGPGIEAGERERVFEKFYRVERPGSPTGIGLGLAICKGIVEAHHGRIGASERPGGGTVITFTLPLKATGGCLEEVPGVEPETKGPDC